MSLQNLSIKDEYRSYSDDIVNDFLIPIVSEAITYDRAVGFFSSSSLIELTKGIEKLVKSNGKIRMIASPRLSEEDIKAIYQGYKKKNATIENSIIQEIQQDFSEIEKKQLNLLTNLIAKGYLDIKIALVENNHGIGIYHEKMGILSDQSGNKVAFSGSLNESKFAFTLNYEAIDVYCSWKGDEQRVHKKVAAFERLWNNTEKQVKIYEFPEVAMDELMKFKVDDSIDLSLIRLPLIVKETSKEYTPETQYPRIPEEIEIRPYQIEAITKWKKQKYSGIFDMATGTGKTITGLAATVTLSEQLDHKLAIIIVCPYQHLVNQWVEDIELFNMKPIIGYSTSPQKKWKERLKKQVRFYNLDIIKNFCFVTTNATFSSKEIQEEVIKKLKKDFLIIVDEAHNFGAQYLQKVLPKNAKYRLGLSATIDRYGDEDGTKSLYDYFGEKCIEYTLKMAIENKMLTPYYYYPIIVYLTEEELNEYRELTKKIGKSLVQDRNGKVEFQDSTKVLLMKRARLVAGAEGKINALEQAMMEHKEESHILVYCGATTINDPNYKENQSPDEEEARQIDVVSKLLGNKLNMRVAQFTSNESASERETIKKTFEEGTHLQALVAIKCLDEGVNIPSIKTAFILASSTNPKEYIQRRGRVLRKYPRKTHSVIYDFITLPASSDELMNFTEDEIKSLRGLAMREITRMKDFASIAENASQTAQIIEDLKVDYLFYFEEGEQLNDYI